MNTEYQDIIAHITMALETDDIQILEMIIESDDESKEGQTIYSLAVAAKTALEEKWEFENQIDEIKSCLN